MTRIDHGFDAALGSLVRDHRLARGMTQDDLALRIGVTFQQVQKYETGRNRISVSRLFLIARAFGLTATEMLREFEVTGDQRRAVGGG